MIQLTIAFVKHRTGIWIEINRFEITGVTGEFRMNLFTIQIVLQETVSHQDLHNVLHHYNCSLQPSVMILSQALNSSLRVTAYQILLSPRFLRSNGRMY